MGSDCVRWSLGAKKLETGRLWLVDGVRQGNTSPNRGLDSGLAMENDHECENEI